jgi:hypothetical protein
MNTWNDHIQYQMLLDALNLNNNSLVGLSSDYYRSCRHVIDYYTFVGFANGGTLTIDQNIFSNDITNFLLGIPFAADSSHMEGLLRTSTVINCTVYVQATGNPMAGAVGATIVNASPATHCVFAAICDWNLIMASNDTPVPGQCYSSQTALNALLYQFGYYSFLHILFEY